MRVAKIPDSKAIKTLGNKYGIIQAKIKKEILNIDILNYSMIKIVQVKSKIDKYIDKLDEIAGEFSASQFKPTYDDMKKKSSVSLRILGKKPLPEIGEAFHEDTIQGRINEMNKYMARANRSISTLASSYFLMLGSLNSEILKVREFANLSPADEAELLAWISDATLNQDMKGLSRNSLAAKIMDYLQAKVANGNFIVVNGRHYNLKKYSMLVARTELRNTQTDAVKNACNQYDNDLVEISDHGTETEICKEYEGNVYSLSGSTPGYSQIEAFPPFHPNCEHFMSPTSEEAIAFQKER